MINTLGSETGETMKKPLVSTITACFRMQRYLKDWLEALPRQTFFHEMEVVLDHNEPTEEEVEWVRAFQQQYPGRLKHIIVNKVDPMGVSWNRCIREASGELLTIWNVDDLRTPESVEQQADVLLNHSEISIVYGNYRIVNAFKSTAGQLIEHLAIPPSELTRSMILGPFFMFRKSLCQIAGYFDEQLLSGADFDLAIRLALHGKAAIAFGELGYYLDEGLGASTRPNSKQPVERTVIELRYGIYDKIDYGYLPHAAMYNIPYICNFGEWKPVRDFVPEYQAFMEERRNSWFAEGLVKYSNMLIAMDNPDRKV